MASTLETTGPLARRLSMAVPVDTVRREVDARLRKLSRTVKMAGFRPGKVPIRLVEQSYGASVQAEVVGDAVSRAFSDAVGEHRLKVAGEPRIEPAAGGATPEDHLGFVAVFEVFPEIVLADPSSMEVERAACTVGEAEIDRTVEILRKQRVQWLPAARPAQDGDRLTIDFLGTLDGVAFPGGSADDFAFVLGEGRMLADFETGVRGAAEGDKRTFPVAFPADYGSAELAGKTASFDVVVKKVEAPQLPELDEAFARSLGVADGSLEKMRADVRANLEREVGQRVRARTKASVMASLPGLASVELPSVLVEREAAVLVERAKADLQARGIDVSKMPPVPPDAFKEQAESRVRLGLIVGEIVQRENLQAKPDQIRRQIEEFAQAYENPGEVIRHFFSDRSRLAEVEAMVVEQNVVDWALSRARVVDKTLAFDDLMQG